jgi:HEPN domain
MLRNPLPTDSPLRRGLPDLAELTDWAIEARYPGDWPDSSERDARTARSQARAVVDSVRADLVRRSA